MYFVIYISSVRFRSCAFHWSDQCLPGFLAKVYMLNERLPYLILPSSILHKVIQKTRSYALNLSRQYFKYQRSIKTVCVKIVPGKR